MLILRTYTTEEEMCKYFFLVSPFAGISGIKECFAIRVQFVIRIRRDQKSEYNKCVEMFVKQSTLVAGFQRALN